MLLVPASSVYLEWRRVAELELGRECLPLDCTLYIQLLAAVNLHEFTNFTHQKSWAVNDERVKRISKRLKLGIGAEISNSFSIGLFSSAVHGPVMECQAAGATTQSLPLLLLIKCGVLMFVLLMCTVEFLPPKALPYARLHITEGPPS